MRFLNRLFTRAQQERDLDAELRAYLDQLTDEKRAAGMDPEQARRAARIELGGIEQVKEGVRETRSGRMFEDFLGDLRYGFRMLRKNPGFSAVAVLVLALGIGANTAMYSVAYGLLLRPLPYPGADRVVTVCMNYLARDFEFGTLCIRDYLMWKENNRAFENPSLFTGRLLNIGGKEGVPEQVRGASVTAGFFSTLEVRPVIGRTFAEGDDKPATGSLAVLGESIWRRRFAASPAVLGQIILVNGTPSTVIGVVPGAVRFPGGETEVWTNLILNPPARYGPWFYRGIARLKPGVTLLQAQLEMNGIGRRMVLQHPDYQRVGLPVRTLRESMLGKTLRPAILLLAGAVGLVLLIAVVNVANLLLARSSVREREMALRRSLGAGSGRLVRQLLTESVLLAVSGGTAGLALAWAAIEAIRAWNPGNLPLIETVKLDLGALAFMVAVSLVAGVLFGLAPALECVRADLHSTMKEGGRAGIGRARARMRAGLVIAEVALSLMLLLGAGLLIRSYANLQGISGGFSTPPRRILTMLISPADRKYNEAPAGLAFYDEVLRRARAVPGVESAALTDSLPPDGQGDADGFEIEGQTLAAGETNPVVSDATVGPDFFRTLGVPLLRGRSFTIHDAPSSAQVAIVSEGFARRFFPNQNPIGKRIKQSVGLGNPWREIVGVSGDVKYLGLAVDTDPAYYLPFAQTYGPRMFLAVRSAGDAATLTESLRKTVQSIDPGVTLAQIGTMEQALRLSVSQPRFDTLLLTSFAGIALILAAVGLYGLIAYSVAQRTHEIGVRMALGAAQRDVVLMVLRQGATLAAIGIAIGLGGAFALTHFLQTMLFGVGPTDALTFAAAPFAMLVVVLLATMLQALGATRISPVAALRYE